jgi:hypothetical protein
MLFLHLLEPQKQLVVLSVIIMVRPFIPLRVLELSKPQQQSQQQKYSS